MNAVYSTRKISLMRILERKDIYFYKKRLIKFIIGHFFGKKIGAEDPKI